MSRFRAGLAGLVTLAALSACSQTHLTAYDATATVTYTWQATYTPQSSRDRPSDTRIEQFDSTLLVNHNGLEPAAAVTGPDDKGLWWPALPPQPSVAELEARAQPGERFSAPEIVKTVDYALSYDQGGTSLTLPTNHEVYRTAAKAYPNQQPLSITLGPQDASVIGAEVSAGAPSP